MSVSDLQKHIGMHRNGLISQSDLAVYFESQMDAENPKSVVHLMEEAVLENEFFVLGMTKENGFPNFLDKIEAAMK